MPAEIRVFRCLSDNIGALIHDPATGACAAVDAPEEAPIVKALEETGWTLSEISSRTGMRTTCRRSSP